MDIFKEILWGIKDFRQAHKVQYDLHDILMIVILGTLCGMNNFCAIADWASENQDDLRDYFALPEQMPSHDTLRRIFSLVSHEELYDMFEDLTAFLSDRVMDVVAIDGKTIRNSQKNGYRPITVLNAWCHQNGVCIGQMKIDGKTNEIKALPDFLEILDVAGCTVTLDAAGCHRKICEKVLEKEADYLITLKKNQGTLWQDVKDYFADRFLLNHSLVHAQSELNKGRVEERTAYITHDIDYFTEHHKWPGLKAVGMVHKRVIEFNQRKEEITSEETRYFILSQQLDAKHFLDKVRAHWSVENNLHWVLDVNFNEDKSGIREENTVLNMSLIRKISMNFLSQIPRKKSTSIKSIQRKLSFNFDNIINLFNNNFHA